MRPDSPRHTRHRDERSTYSVAEAAAILGISRSTAYECIQTGQLPALHFGRRILIPRRPLEQMLGLHPAEPGSTESMIRRRGTGLDAVAPADLGLSGQ